MCVYCGEEVKGAIVRTGTGVAHRHCFELQHEPGRAETLYQVARGHHDPRLAAEVIAQYVPIDLAVTIVNAYNEQLHEQWKRRCLP